MGSFKSRRDSLLLQFLPCGFYCIFGKIAKQLMRQAEKDLPLSLDEYLQLEKDRQQKYEYYDGYAYAMAGGSYAHNTIAGNLMLEVGVRLKGKSCQIMNSDTKLYLQTKNSYVYPDAMILCEQRREAEACKDAFTNPVVIFEVLSESTAGFDRGEKFRLYRQIDTLQHYVLLEQDVAKIDVYSRKNPTALWQIRTLEGLTETLDLELPDDMSLAILLEDIYARIFS